MSFSFEWSCLPLENSCLPKYLRQFCLMRKVRKYIYIHFSFMNFENGFVLDASKWRFHNSLLGTLRLPIKAFSYCYPFLWAKIHETVNNPPFCLYLFNPSSFMYISVIERGEVLEFLVDWTFQTLASSHRTCFDVFRRLLQNRFLFCEKKLEFVPCLR